MPFSTINTSPTISVDQSTNMSFKKAFKANLGQSTCSGWSRGISQKRHGGQGCLVGTTRRLWNTTHLSFTNCLPVPAHVMVLSIADSKQYILLGVKVDQLPCSPWTRGGSQSCLCFGRTPASIFYDIFCSRSWAACLLGYFTFCTLSSSSVKLHGTLGDFERKNTKHAASISYTSSSVKLSLFIYLDRTPYLF